MRLALPLNLLYKLHFTEDVILPRRPGLLKLTAGCPLRFAR
jgi:hypothetical protein